MAQLVIVQRPMFNAPERVEFYIALANFREIPISTPRTSTRLELIERLEHYLSIAQHGEIVGVDE